MNAKTGPPVKRSPLWREVNQAAAEGLFKLPVCRACGRVHYPPQEFCRACLSDDWAWEAVSDAGTVLSWTVSHASLNPFFKARLPLRIGSVKLDCGPVLLAHLSAACARTGSRARVTGRPDPSGQVVFFATPPEDDSLAEFAALLQA